jgi:pheromone shutdown protein TraB
VFDGFVGTHLIGGNLKPITIRHELQKRKSRMETNPIQIDENITVHILGTAHVSEKSVEEVEACIQQLMPNNICVELCKNRFGMLKNKINLDLTFFEIYRNSDSMFKAILSYFNISIAKKLGTIPGGEFRKAYEIGSACMIPVHLIDRDVGETLKRCWAFLSTWNKMKFMYNLTIAAYSGVNKEEIEVLKELDVLSQFMLEFGNEFPELLQVLIDERDQYMAKRVLNIVDKCKQRRREFERIQDERRKKLDDSLLQSIRVSVSDSETSFDRVEAIHNEFEDESEEEIVPLQKDVIFCVVGAGHVAGMTKYIQNRDIFTTPKPIPVSNTNYYLYAGVVMFSVVLLYYFFK